MLQFAASLNGEIKSKIGTRAFGLQHQTCILWTTKGSKYGLFEQRYIMKTVKVRLNKNYKKTKHDEI